MINMPVRVSDCDIRAVCNLLRRDPAHAVLGEKLPRRRNALTLLPFCALSTACRQSISLIATPLDKITELSHY
jgi:hypothetical protein